MPACLTFRQLLSGIDVQPLLGQIAEHPELWGNDDIWTRGKPTSALEGVDNIVLRYNRSSQPNLHDWNRPAFNILSEAIPIIFDLMRAIPGEELGRVIISRLPSGGIIPEHIDHAAPGYPVYWHRYQIPLSVFPGVEFHCGDEELYMEPGNAYWFNNQIMHSVINNSDEVRISMLADIRPFTQEAT